jgi:large subunit ribosomal protein L23
VPLDANKVEIRQAVQKVFSVRVQSVNTIKVGGKARRRGWVAGRRPDWKKALVTLHPDDSLDVY